MNVNFISRALENLYLNLQLIKMNCGCVSKSIKICHTGDNERYEKVSARCGVAYC